MACGQQVTRYTKVDGKRVVEAQGSCVLEMGHDPEIGHKIAADVMPAPTPDPVTAYDGSGNVIWTARLVPGVDPDIATVAAVAMPQVEVDRAYRITVGERTIKDRSGEVLTPDEPVTQQQDLTTRFKPARQTRLSDQLVRVRQAMELGLLPRLNANPAPHSDVEIIEVTLSWDDFETLLNHAAAPEGA